MPAVVASLSYIESSARARASTAHLKRGRKDERIAQNGEPWCSGNYTGPIGEHQQIFATTDKIDESVIELTIYGDA